MEPLEVICGPAAEETRDAMMQPLIDYNQSVAGPHGYLVVAVPLRDAAGAITGGLWGFCDYDWLHVGLLVVPEAARRTGLGTRVMAAAEGFARERGLAGIWLDTFGFQARGFYEKLGFTCFGTLADHPRGGARHFMQKRL